MVKYSIYSRSTRSEALPPPEQECLHTVRCLCHLSTRARWFAVHLLLSALFGHTRCVLAAVYNSSVAATGWGGVGKGKRHELRRRRQPDDHAEAVPVLIGGGLGSTDA